MFSPSAPDTTMQPGRQPSMEEMIAIMQSKGYTVAPQGAGVGTLRPGAAVQPPQPDAKAQEAANGATRAQRTSPRGHGHKRKSDAADANNKGPVKVQLPRPMLGCVLTSVCV